MLLYWIQVVRKWALFCKTKASSMSASTGEWLRCFLTKSTPRYECQSGLAVADLVTTDHYSFAKAIEKSEGNYTIRFGIRQSPVTPDMFDFSGENGVLDARFDLNTQRLGTRRELLIVLLRFAGTHVVGETPFHAAARENADTVLDVYLRHEQGQDLLQQADAEGMTALHCTTMR